MSDHGPPGDRGKTPILDALTPEEREQLGAKRFVQTGDDVVWIEPGGHVRREKAAKLYYIQTDRGVFRVSRITKEVIEV